MAREAHNGYQVTWFGAYDDPEPSDVDPPNEKVEDATTGDKKVADDGYEGGLWLNATLDFVLCAGEYHRVEKAGLSQEDTEKMTTEHKVGRLTAAIAALNVEVDEAMRSQDQRYVKQLMKNRKCLLDQKKELLKNPAGAKVATGATPL